VVKIARTKIFSYVSISVLAICGLAWATLSFGQGHLVATWEQPALSRSVLNGDAEAVKQELSRGADPNAIGPDGLSPLHQSVIHARTTIAQLLLDAHANPDIRTGNVRSMPNRHWTPLFFAVMGGREDLVKLLLKYGADANGLDADNNTPLYYGVARGANEIAAILVQAGARPLIQTPQPSLDSRPQFYSSDSSGWHASPLRVPELYVGVVQFDARKVESLLKKGADPNERAPSGHAPLHEAMKADPEISRLLLKYGADPNIRIQNASSNRWTPIFFAAYYGRDDLIEILLNAGAKADVTDAFGRTPLYYAKQKNKPKAAALLNRAGSRD